MNPSDMYHLMGIREQECTCAKYSGSVAVLYVRTKKNEFYCAKCGSRHVIRSGVVEREFRSVPVGGKPVVVRMRVQRLECKECGSVSQEHIHFAKPGRSYTRRMATYVVDLSRVMTLKAVSAFTGLSWNTVKEIVETYLERHYSRPDLSEVTVIGIDEFAVKKGHVYKTIVVDLLSGRILYVGDGKGAEALDGFWRRLGDSKAKIKAVAMDMSGAFVSAERANLPQASIVFDHFHVVKLVNEALDKVRRRVVREEKDKESKEAERRKAAGLEPVGGTPRSSIVKGTRYILLRSHCNIEKKKDIERLNAALELNKDLSTAYYLKEEASLIWKCDNKGQAAMQLSAWLAGLRASEIPELLVLADTISDHKDGILAYYDTPISTGPVEGINNKIKTLKRMAYGFRDDHYFKLRLLALHDFKVA